MRHSPKECICLQQVEQRTRLPPGFLADPEINSPKRPPRFHPRSPNTRETSCVMCSRTTPQPHRSPPSTTKQHVFHVQKKLVLAKNHQEQLAQRPQRCFTLWEQQFLSTAVRLDQVKILGPDQLSRADKETSRSGEGHRPSPTSSPLDVCLGHLTRCGHHPDNPQLATIR